MSKKENEDIKVVDKRAGSLKLFSVGSIILLLVIIIVANVLFDQIFGKALTFDFSRTGQNSVSVQTQAYIDSLAADTRIRIVGLCDRPTSLKDTPYEYIVPLLDDMASKSSEKISVDYINPSTYPTIVSELDPNGLYDLKADTYVVEYQGKIRVLDPINLFTYDSQALQSGYYVPISNNVESSFTNAMINLTTLNHKKAYFVTGLQNTDSHTQLSALLEALVVDSEDLQASDYFTVPTDCDVLILSGINQDITESMKIAITDYLHNNGKLLVSLNLSASNAQVEFTNLNDLLNLMNISVGNSLMLETDNNYILQSNNANVMTGSYSIVVPYDTYSSFSSSNAFISYMARPISKSGNPEPYVEASPVLISSELATTGVVDSQGYVTTSGDKSTKNVAMYSTFNGTSTKVYVFGTETFTSDGQLSAGFTTSNASFIKSVLTDLVGVENMVDIPTKALADFSLNTEMATGNYISVMSVVLMVVVPLAFIICGAVVYKKRKNL